MIGRLLRLSDYSTVTADPTFTRHGHIDGDEIKFVDVSKRLFEEHVILFEGRVSDAYDDAELSDDSAKSQAPQSVNKVHNTIRADMLKVRLVLYSCSRCWKYVHWSHEDFWKDFGLSITYPIW